MSNPFGKMDRNTLAKSQFAHQKFAQQFSSGAVHLMDRFNNPIEKGSLVLFRADAKFDPIYQVVDVAPILDPTQPPGLVKIVLTMGFATPYHTARPASDLIVVGKSDESGNHASVEGPKMSPPPTDIEVLGDAALELGEHDERD